MVALAKLDPYDYKVIKNRTIRIKLTRSSDPILVDILSDIYDAGGRIYVEGDFFSYLDEHQIVRRGNHIFLELSVELTQN